MIRIDEYAGDYQITVGVSSVESFREMIHRATNLWPNAPADIKHFADMLLHGKAHQDYFEQNKDLVDTRTVHQWIHKCSCGYNTVVRTRDSDPPLYAITCANPSIEVTLPDNKVKVMPCKRTELFRQ